MTYRVTGWTDSGTVRHLGERPTPAEALAIVDTLAPLGAWLGPWAWVVRADGRRWVRRSFRDGVARVTVSVDEVAP